MTLTDTDLVVLAHALDHLHEPFATPLRDMPAVLHARNAVAAEMQERAGKAQAMALAKQLGGMRTPSDEAPPGPLREVPPLNGADPPDPPPRTL